MFDIIKSLFAPQPLTAVAVDPLDRLLEQKLQEAKKQQAALLLAQERQKKAALIEQVSLELAQADISAVANAVIESLAKAEIIAEVVATQHTAAEQLLANPAAAVAAKKAALLAQMQQNP